ncbi:MAG: HAD-IIIA family hydrolase [Bacteroidales bacterium]|nr:HAD-IIIA family hydrolase [Bacteroidales bacterium]
MKIEGIIFDLDGTLVHTIEDIAGAANVLFARHGLPEHGIDYYLKWIGNGAVKFIERAHGQPVSEEQLKAYVSEFKEIYAGNLHDQSHLYEGIPKVLDELVSRGIKISVLSNKPHLLTRKVCEFYLSDWPLDPVLGQREEVPRKPDPAAAFEIAKHMDIAPDRILFVGDSDNDILTAQAAGMIPLGVSWGYGRLVNNPVEGMGTLAEQPSEILNIVS